MLKVNIYSLISDGSDQLASLGCKWVVGAYSLQSFVDERSLRLYDSASETTLDLLEINDRVSSTLQN